MEQRTSKDIKSDLESWKMGLERGASSALLRMEAQRVPESQAIVEADVSAKARTAEVNKPTPGFWDVQGVARQDPDVIPDFAIMDALSGWDGTTNFKSALTPSWRSEPGGPVKGFWAANQKDILSFAQSDDELEFLSENVQGPKSLAAAQARVLMNRENSKAYGDAGFWTALGGQLYAGTTGSPLSAIATVATAGLFRAAKIGQGAYVAAGRANAAAVSALAEGAVVGVALEGAADLSGRVKGIEDYAMSIGGDMLFTGLTARGAFRAAAEAHQVNVANGMLRIAAEAKGRATVDPAMGESTQVKVINEALTPDQSGDVVMTPDMMAMVENDFHLPPPKAEPTATPDADTTLEVGPLDGVDVTEVEFESIPLELRPERKPEAPPVEAEVATVKAEDDLPTSPVWSYALDGTPIVSLMTKETGKLGYNEGGRYKGSDGTRWYIKQAQSAAHAANEMLVNKLYGLFGVRTPEVFRVDADGKPALASKWIETAKPMTAAEMRADPDVRGNFAVDALLSNWDAVGSGDVKFSNIVSTSGGTARIEGGGGLLFGGAGGSKGDKFTSDASDLDSMRNPDINPETAAVFADLTPAELKANLSRLEAVDSSKMDDLIEDAFANVLTPGERASLMVKMENRKTAMQEKLTKEIAALEKKADPTIGTIKKSVVSGVGTEGVIHVTWTTPDSDPEWVKKTTGKKPAWEGTVHGLLKMVAGSKSKVAQVYKGLAAHLMLNVPDGALKNVKAAMARTAEGGKSSLVEGVMVPGANVDEKPVGPQKKPQKIVDDMDDYNVGVILHESMHAITQGILHLWQYQPNSLSQSTRNVLNGLEGVLWQLRSKYPDWETATSGPGYAAQNLHELVSQSFNDRDTIEALLNMKGADDKYLTNVFGQVVQSFVKLMGFTYDKYNGTAYRQVMHAAEHMMANRPGVVMADGRPLASLPGKPPEGLFKTATVDNAKFQEWHKGTVMLDEDGEPRIFYHGTNAQANFAQFKKYHSNGAVFFSTAKSFAKSHAGVVDDNKLIAVYIKAKEVFDVGNPWHLARLDPVARSTFENANNPKHWTNFDTQEMADALNAAGFDGWWEEEGSATNLAVLSNDQIKSVFNDGDFSSPDNIYGAPTPSLYLPQNAGVNPIATIHAKEKFAKQLYSHARAFVEKNPIDLNKLRVLTSKFGSMSDGLRLAKSTNPIMQMVASLVTETTTGAAGRKKTAALRKHMLVNQLTGRSVRSYRDAYSAWLTDNNIGRAMEAVTQEGRAKFDREVMIEILQRRETGEGATVDPNVRMAADELQELFTRSLDAQKKASVLGAIRLPETSVGYVPQALSGKKLAVATGEELNMLQDHLASHFVDAMGWSSPFSEQFSKFYLNRARQRTLNTKGVDAMGGANSADVVRDTLEAMSTSQGDPSMIDAALKAMAEFSKAGMGQTKKRLDVGLLHELPNGKLVMDYYETDTLTLARRYVNRTAGTVALTEVGVHGSQGVRHLREAITAMGEQVTGTRRASQEEIDAFDRVMGEMLGGEIPGEVRSNAATNLATFTRLAQLGGMGITQFAETFNAVGALGLTTTLKVIGNLPKMLGEVGRVKRGQDPMNHVLTSLEVIGGPLGMESYNLHVPLEADDRQLAEYVRDSGIGTRLLSGMSHLQAKISLLRGISAAQHRAVAEQITLKAMRYIRDTEFSGEGATMVSRTSPRAVAALGDMGFTPEMVRALKSQLGKIAEWDGSDRLSRLDLTQVDNPALAQAFVAAVQRGTSQIIQQTYIGERAHWMHNDYFKVLAQMRTFGVTATEKQWARTRRVHGFSYASGVLLAQMAMVVPLHAARVHAAAVGREDQEEYIKDNLSPAALIRATLNYSSLSGLSGDLVEQLSMVAHGWAPDEYKPSLKEGLAIRGTGQGGIASVVPALGMLDRGYKAATGGGSVYSAAKLLPGANLPYVVPILNMLKEDE